MSQPKSMKTNDELIEEFDQMLQKTKGTVEWTAIENYWRQALAQKDAEVAEAEQRVLSWVKMILGYKHVDTVIALIDKKLQAHPTKQTEAN